MSLQVQSNGAIGVPTYDFLLMYNNNHMAARKNVLSLIITPNFWTPIPTLTQGRFFSKSNDFNPGSEGSLPPRTKSGGWILFQIFVHRQKSISTHTHPHGKKGSYEGLTLNIMPLFFRLHQAATVGSEHRAGFWARIPQRSQPAACDPFAPVLGGSLPDRACPCHCNLHEKEKSKKELDTK